MKRLFDDFEKETRRQRRLEFFVRYVFVPLALVAMLLGCWVVAQLLS